MPLLYRARQFFQSLFCKPQPGELEEIEAILPERLYHLFLELPAADQCHSYRVFQTLVASGENNQDLLSAALLHDVGKSRYRLNIIERILIVFAEHADPERMRHWGQGAPRGWKRAFVIAIQHPSWGADMVSSAGGSKILVRLIQNHHTHPATPTGDHFAALLARLKQADSIN